MYTSNENEINLRKREKKIELGLVNIRNFTGQSAMQMLEANLTFYKTRELGEAWKNIDGCNRVVASFPKIKIRRK